MKKIRRVICPACGKTVTPKKVKRTIRNGKIMSFYQYEYNCPKCSEQRIWEK